MYTCTEINIMELLSYKLEEIFNTSNLLQQTFHIKDSYSATLTGGGVRYFCLGGGSYSCKSKQNNMLNYYAHCILTTFINFPKSRYPTPLNFILIFLSSQYRNGYRQVNYLQV